MLSSFAAVPTMNKSHTLNMASPVHVVIYNYNQKEELFVLHTNQSASTCAKQHWQMVCCDNNYIVVSGLAEDFLWEVSDCSCDDAPLKMGGGPAFYSLTGCFR